MTVLLSNPTLDSLYAIRRIFVGRYNASHKINDLFGMGYYEDKVKALDEAIVAFIEVNKVDPSHVEQSMAERARQLLGVRIPGNDAPVT